MSLDADTRRAAQILWDYLKLNQPLKRCDCAIAMGSHDVRVAEHAAHLVLQGWAPRLVCSGGFGRLTREVWHLPEAHRFAEAAEKAGLSRDKILLEDQSTNTSENILFSRQLIASCGISAQAILLVHKPYMERRALATALKVWPEVAYCVSSPPLSFADYPNEEISIEVLLQIMVGDFQRILLYPEKGFQIEQDAPPAVMRAFHTLKSKGYIEHILPENGFSIDQST